MGPQLPGLSSRIQSTSLHWISSSSCEVRHPAVCRQSIHGHAAADAVHIANAHMLVPPCSAASNQTHRLRGSMVPQLSGCSCVRQGWAVAVAAHSNAGSSSNCTEQYSRGATRGSNSSSRSDSSSSVTELSTAAVATERVCSRAGTGGQSSNGKAGWDSSSQFAVLPNQQLTGAAIMKRLKAACSCQELQQLVQQHNEQLNWRHSSALLTHLAQLTKQQEQQQQKMQMQRRKQQPPSVQQGDGPLVSQQEQQHEQPHYGSSNVQPLTATRQLQAETASMDGSGSAQASSSSSSSSRSHQTNSSSSSSSTYDPGIHQLVLSVLPLIDRHIQQYDARGLANTVWALARLQQASQQQQQQQQLVGAAWLSRFCSTSQPLLQQFDAQQLANTLWALVKLQHCPPPAWLQEWYRTMGARANAAAPGSSQSSSLDVQALSNAVWSITQLPASSRPAPAVLDQLLTSAAVLMQQGNHSSSGSSAFGQALSNILWSCAQLQHALPVLLLQAAHPWLQGLAVGQHLARQQLSNQSLANSMWALAKLHQLQQQQQQQPQDGTAGSDDQQGSSSNEASSSSKPDLLHSCGAVLLQLSSPRLHQLSSQHLSNVVWAVGVLQLQPNHKWLVRVQQQMAAAAAELQDQQVANMLWGLSQLIPLQQHKHPASQQHQQHSTLQADALQGVLEQQQRKLPAYSSQALSSSLLSVARLGFKVPEPLLQSWLKEVARRNYLSAAGGRAMAECCCALTLIRRREEDFASTAAQPAAGRAISRGGSNSSSRFLGFGFQHSFDSEWLTGFCTASSARLASFTGEQLSGLGWAMASLRFRPAVPWLLAWHAALSEKAADMSAEAAAKALWALQRLPAGPQGAAKEAAALKLVAAAAEAAAAGGTDAHSLALAASCIAAVAGDSSTSSRRQDASQLQSVSSSSSHVTQQAMQQLLHALPRLLLCCSSQQLVMILSAAASVHAAVPKKLQAAVLQRLQQLAQTRQLDSRGSASALAALAKLKRTDGLWHYRRHQQQQSQALSLQQPQQQMQLSPPLQSWMHSMLQCFAMRTAGPFELSLMLWSLATLDHNPGRRWLAGWAHYSQPQLHSFTPAQLASCGWALTVLNHKPDAAWQAAWLQSASLQAPAAKVSELALIFYAAGALQFQVDRAWLQSAALLAANSIRRWSVRDMAMGLWGLAQLGLRVVADAEVLEVLLGHMVTATAAAEGMELLSPHQQLQLLQTVVLLRQTPADELVTTAAAALGERQQQRQQLSKSAIRRMRWRAKMAAETADAAGAAASAAISQHQQQLRVARQPQLSHNRSSAVGSESAAAAAVAAAFAAQEAISTWEAAASKAAAVAAAVLVATTGRSPDSAGLPVDQSWLRLWCKASAQQMHRYTPRVAAAALSAGAALGLPGPPVAWQRQVLLQVLRQRRRLSQQDVAAVTHALGLLQSPLLAQWLGQIHVRYVPHVLPDASGAEQLQQQRRSQQQQQQQHRFRRLCLHWSKGMASSRQSQARYPQQFNTHSLLQLRQQQRTLRLTAWWKRQRQLQQQCMLQRQWRSAAAVEAARAVWRPAPAGGINGYSSNSLYGSYTPSSSSSESPAGSLDSVPAAISSRVSDSGSDLGSTVGPKLAERKLRSGLLAARPVRQAVVGDAIAPASSSTSSTDNNILSSSTGTESGKHTGAACSDQAAAHASCTSDAASDSSIDQTCSSKSPGWGNGRVKVDADGVIGQTARSSNLAAAAVPVVDRSLPISNITSVEGYSDGFSRVQKHQRLTWACQID